MDFDKIIAWGKVATAELQTLVDYTEHLAVVDDKDKLLEIMADEGNHCCVALKELFKLLGVKIPTDNLEAFDEIFNEGEQE